MTHLPAPQAGQDVALILHCLWARLPQYSGVALSSCNRQNELSAAFAIAHGCEASFFSVCMASDRCSFVARCQDMASMGCMQGTSATSHVATFLIML